jgi:hypothetical protein
VNQLVPLILIWMFANRSTSPQASLSRKGAPQWPTPKSPPPMPAFDAIRSDPYATTPLSADPSHSSTPLAQLHNAPPKVQPASASIPDTIKKQAQHAFQRKATAALAKAAPQKHAAPIHKKAMAPATKAANQSARSFAVKHALSVPTQGPTLQNSAATTQSVANLQQILNQRGAKLKQDGLYGPKTAAAWKAAAKSKGLPNTIARVNSTTAKVAARTYDSLSIP